MKSFIKILVFLAALAGLYIALMGIRTGLIIHARPGEWLGGRLPELTLIWYYITFIASGFIGFISLLALAGLAFGTKGRKSAFWLFVLPGFLGMLTAITAFGLQIYYQPDWQAYGPVIFAALFIPSLTFWLSGRFFRKSIGKQLNKGVSKWSG